MLSLSARNVVEKILDVPQGDLKAEETKALAEAKKYNEAIKHVQIGFAKAVCTLERDKNLHWYLRIIEEISGEVQDFVSSPSEPLIHQASRATKQFPKKNTGSTSEPKIASASCSSSSTPQQIDHHQDERISLVNAIRGLIQTIEKNEGVMINPKEVERKLRKIIIYLLKSETWPFDKSIKDVEGMFRQYDRQFVRRKRLSAENQQQFNQTLSQLSKGLHERLMTLEDIRIKIFTKSQRSSPVGLETFDRIKNLLRTGTERIYHLQPRNGHTTNEQIKTFSLALAFHAYVYKPNVDNEQSRFELKQQVERLIDVLADYDLRFQNLSNTGVLLSFFRRVLGRINRHFKGEMSLGKGLPPLLWTLDVLVNTPHFIEYMQPLGRRVEDVTHMVKHLFTIPETWKAVVDFIIPLGDPILFHSTLNQTPTLINRFNQNQIDYIFHKLNIVLQDQHHVLKDQYHRMFLDFIELLANNNLLHYLQRYAKEVSHVSMLRSNLIERLEFSFMHEITAIESFFGNPTYLAINDPTLPDGMNAKQTLVKLFNGYTKNPVIEKERFRRKLAELMTDFNDLFYESLCEIILSVLGESTTSTSLPVEQWLEEDVIDFYHSIKGCILRCMPLNWETLVFDDQYQISPIGRICLYEGKLYLITRNGDGAIELTELFSHSKSTDVDSQLILVSARDRLNALLPATVVQALSVQELSEQARSTIESHPPLIQSSSSSQMSIQDGGATTASVLASLPFDEVKERLKDLMALEENRRAVSDLTAAFMSFQNHREIKGEIANLLQVIFAKLKQTEAVSFRNRLLMVRDFLQAMSPFFKQLELLIEQRFFKKGWLKESIARNVISQAEAAGITHFGDTLQPLINVGPIVSSSSSPAATKVDIAFSSLLVKQLTPLVSTLCVKDIREILDRCSSLETLKEITPQLEYVIGRKIDELSYSTHEFRDAFCNRQSNQPVQQGLIISDIVNITDVEEIKERIIREYGTFLKERPIPVNFILPNQAIAIRLCLAQRLADHNLLIKLGTGQGKSLVIAMAALNEAQKVRNNPNGKVLVFTGFDHLAKRDHEFGEYFFRKEGLKSLCISKIEDLNRYASDVNIIYADIENISGIIQDSMLKLLENHATPQEKEFMNLIYGNVPGEEIRIILDEYDLLLHDLHYKTPYVSWIRPRLMDTTFVQNNRAYFPYLRDQVQSNSASSSTSAGADPNSGKEFVTVPFYSRNGGFHLYATVMRLSEMIKRSRRVIGLSGTAVQTQTHGLRNVLFFEIPSSQNPNVFETRIQENPREAIADESYISCQQKLSLPILREDGGIPVLDQSTVNRYCQEIVEDIVKAREEKRDSTTYRRPVLVFGDPLFKYKLPGSPVEHNLWSTLQTAIRNANIPLKVLTRDVQDVDLQDIARSGEVTLTTIKYGRGADIRVSLDIEGGLHVILGIPVEHDRLVRQLIGRTGRMGRRGSYSAITFGPLTKDEGLSPSERNRLDQQAEFYDVLHTLTKLFVHSQNDSRTYNEARCKKWLMFLSQSKSNGSLSDSRYWKINRSHAVELIGRVLPADLPARYFE